MNASPLHIWAVIRLLPNMQRVVMQRFRRRGDAENYLYVLRRYVHDTKLIIVFDPPSNTTHPEAHFRGGENETLARPKSPDGER